MDYYEDSFKPFLWNEASQIIKFAKEIFADLTNNDLYTGKLYYLALHQLEFLNTQCKS